MSEFYLTCKCPACESITGYCKDSSLTENRVEYDGKRCKKCTGKSKQIKNHGLACGTGNGMYPSKKKMAILSNRMFTN